jgi:ELWxxDGT repeat protein
LLVAFAILGPVAAFADTASQVFDLSPGSESGVVSFHAAVFDGRLCFRGRNDAAAVDATGDELYCYDGNTVALAADIRPGGLGSFPGDATLYDGQLYFSAESSSDDRELWRWDGVDPPVEVFDLHAGGESSPGELTVYDGQLYFSADDGAGRDLWRYDSGQPIAVGTNPMLVQDFPAAGFGMSRDWIVFDDILYYPAPSGPGEGMELFRFDSSQPIADGTNPRIVADLEPGQPGSDPRQLIVHDDGNLYFTATTGGDFRRRLYRYDGNDPPTKLSDTLDVAQQAMVSYDGELLFYAQDQDLANLTGFELWSYDGSSFVRVEPGLEYSAVLEPFGQLDGFLYFIARGGAAVDYELLKYDGTSPPAPAVDLSALGGGASLAFGGVLQFDGRLYFAAHTATAGIELWALEAGEVVVDVEAVPTLSGWALIVLAGCLAVLACRRM